MIFFFSYHSKPAIILAGGLFLLFIRLAPLLKWKDGNFNSNAWFRNIFKGSVSLVKGRSESKDQAGSWLSWFVHLFGVIECWWHALYSGFAPSSSEAAVGFWLFLYLVIHNLPQLHMHIYAWYVLSFIVSLYFVAQGDIYPCASTAAES